MTENVFLWIQRITAPNVILLAYFYKILMDGRRTEKVTKFVLINIAYDRRCHYD